jgi:hypothetical protein
MSMGDAYSEKTVYSASKSNKTSVISGTGAYLAALDKTKHKLVAATSTSDGYTLDHLYLYTEDGTSKIDLLSVQSHDHTSADTGGILETVFSNNPSLCDLWLTKTNDLMKAQWNQTVTSTGTIVDDTDGTSGERSIKLLTGATSGSGSTISYPHLAIDYSQRSFFAFKARLSSTANVAVHSGVRADDTTAADSNNKKYDAEVCTTIGANWLLRSADGTSNTASDTGTAATTNRVGISIEHFPDLGTPRLDMIIDAGSVFSKTTNIPTSGQGDKANLIKHSLKNSAAADKNYYVYGSRLVFYINDNWVV